MSPPAPPRTPLGKRRVENSNSGPRRHRKAVQPELRNGNGERTPEADTPFSGLSVRFGSASPETAVRPLWKSV